MYEDGKIWVVIAILSVIFAGIALFLFILERKVKRLEQMNKKAQLNKDDKVN